MINELISFLQYTRRKKELQKIEREKDRIRKQFEKNIARLPTADPDAFKTALEAALIQKEISMHLVQRRFHRILPPRFSLAEAAQGMTATEEETLEFFAPFIENGEMKLEEAEDGKYIVNRLSADY